MRIVQILFLIFLFTGCLNEADCLITSTNLVKINFKIDSKTPRKITFTKINVSGVSRDFYAGQEVSYVELPVNPKDTQATFTFNFEGRTETMYLTYSTRAEVISASCGAFTNYSDLSVPETSFQLFNITNQQLLIDARGNIEVFIQ